MSLEIINSIHYGQSIICKDFSKTFDWAYGSENHNKPWVALIGGICEKYGLARDFKALDRVYGKNERIGNYKLTPVSWSGFQPGHCYEYRNFLVDPMTNQLESGFFCVYLDGIVELEREQVRTMLGMPVKKQEHTLSEEEKNYILDDVPF